MNRHEELQAGAASTDNCDLFRARVAELDDLVLSLQCKVIERDAELAAIKAQEPVAYIPVDRETGEEWHPVLKKGSGNICDYKPLYAAPVSEAKAQGDAWAPSVNDYDHSIHSNPDAREWADFFVATFPGLADKHDLMIGWFANAMMAMHDHLARKAQGVVLDGSQLAGLLEQVRLNDDEAKPHGSGATYWNNAVIACQVAIRDALADHAQQVSVPDEMRSLAQRLREYNQNPHHINPMSEAFHILVADAANALSAACVPKEIAAAITWSEHLLFECGALTSTMAPSVHVYNKTFAAVNEARAMLAAPAAPAADAWIVDMYRHLQKVTPYRFKKIQDASITDGGDVMYFHKDRFDAALLADMAAHCAAKGVV